MRLILTAAVLGTATLAAPAAAQDAAGDKVNTVIIYGEDACPQSSPDTITVCAKLPEAERFRIPAILRQNTSPQNESWTSKVLAYQTVGRSGTLSCSPAGAGGWTGCTNKLIKEAYEEKAQDPGIRFGQLIEAERAKRLSTIDAEAADTQRRVEALENSVEARQRAAAQETPAPAPTPAPHN